MPVMHPVAASFITLSGVLLAVVDLVPNLLTPVFVLSCLLSSLLMAGAAWLYGSRIVERRNLNRRMHELALLRVVLALPR